MAVIQGNTRVLCLMALLAISSTLLSSQAAGRNIGLGMEANTAVGLEAKSGSYREPYVYSTCTSKFCDAVCKRDKYSAGHCHKDDDGCRCS